MQNCVLFYVHTLYYCNCYAFLCFYFSMNAQVQPKYVEKQVRKINKSRTECYFDYTQMFYDINRYE